MYTADVWVGPTTRKTSIPQLWWLKRNKDGGPRPHRPLGSAAGSTNVLLSNVSIRWLEGQWMWQGNCLVTWDQDPHFLWQALLPARKQSLISVCMVVQRFLDCQKYWQLGQQTSTIVPFFITVITVDVIITVPLFTYFFSPRVVIKAEFHCELDME